MHVIKYWNRNTHQWEEEKIYGEGFVRFLYENPIGSALTDRVCTRPWFSKLYGKLQNTAWSAKKVPAFIQSFHINMEEYNQPDTFSNFNDFFIRTFKQGKRPFVMGKDMPAFAEGKYFAFERTSENIGLPIKGASLSLSQLLQNKKWIETFAGGPLFIARLAPPDYHRFHFPDDGNNLDSYPCTGPLHSVNPIALKQRPDILFTNERQVSILETKHFGKLAYIEVGAMCVGKIVQTTSSKDFHRGQEKGYFLFGGSTVILVGEPNRWKPTADLLEMTEKGFETSLLLGQKIAQSSAN